MSKEEEANVLVKKAASELDLIKQKKQSFANMVNGSINFGFTSKSILVIEIQKMRKNKRDNSVHFQAVIHNCNSSFSSTLRYSSSMSLIGQPIDRIMPEGIAEIYT